MKRWVLANKEVFERDVLHDFCQASVLLGEQFARFSGTQTVSFPVLREMIGEPLNKGMLWRLKDKAHHVFSGSSEDNPVAVLLDWTLGYIFHESLKLMEDAHQRQYYAPSLESLGNGRKDGEVAGMIRELLAIREETCESMRREASRLHALLLHTRRLFCLYFSGCAGHGPLARFLYDNDALARSAFGEDHARLLQVVYGSEPERMYIVAAQSLLESARGAAAAKAIDAALAINPAHPAALEFREMHGL